MEQHLKNDDLIRKLCSSHDEALVNQQQQQQQQQEQYGRQLKDDAQGHVKNGKTSQDNLKLEIV